MSKPKHWLKHDSVGWLHQQRVCVRSNLKLVHAYLEGDRLTCLGKPNVHNVRRPIPNIVIKEDLDVVLVMHI